MLLTTVDYWGKLMNNVNISLIPRLSHHPNKKWKQKMKTKGEYPRPQAPPEKLGKEPGHICKLSHVLSQNNYVPCVIMWWLATVDDGIPK